MSKPLAIHVNVKCSDMCGVRVYNENGQQIYDGDGYCPTVSGLGSGDYIKLIIDNASGKLIGWQPLSVEDVEGFSQ